MRVRVVDSAIILIYMVNELIIYYFIFIINLENDMFDVWQVFDK